MDDVWEIEYMLRNTVRKMKSGAFRNHAVEVKTALKRVDSGSVKAVDCFRIHRLLGEFCVSDEEVALFLLYNIQQKTLEISLIIMFAQPTVSQKS